MGRSTCHLLFLHRPCFCFPIHSLHPSPPPSALLSGLSSYFFPQTISSFMHCFFLSSSLVFFSMSVCLWLCGFSFSLQSVLSLSFPSLKHLALISGTTGSSFFYFVHLSAHCLLLSRNPSTSRLFFSR